MKYELTKDLETGNRIIDNEHRELLNAVNALLDACSAGKGRAQVSSTVKFLNDYVDRHFAHEEQLQKQSGYPGYEAHHAFHEKYKQTLREITAGMSDNCSIADLAKLNGHVSLLVSHIRTEDKKLGAFLNKEYGHNADRTARFSGDAPFCYRRALLHDHLHIIILDNPR